MQTTFRATALTALARKRSETCTPRGLAPRARAHSIIAPISIARPHDRQSAGQRATSLIFQVRNSLDYRARSIIDLNGGRHARRENDVGRHLIDMDADWDTLSQAHPGEDRIDGSDPLIVGLGI
jgi:hypothetical protein